MNKCTVCFCGLNAEKEVNALTCQGFLLFNSYKCDARTTCITLPRSQVKKVVAYLTKKCYNVKYVTPLGVYGVVHKLTRRPVIAVAIALLLLAVIVCSTLCLDVNCNTRTDEVLTALSEYGIRLGTSLAALDIDRLENFLCVKLDCAYAIVSVDGCVLTVEIIERITAPQPPDLTQPCNIVSNRDALVTRVVTLNGTACVKVGDTVTSGQVLIAGVRTFTDGTTQPTSALGEVYGQVSTSCTLTHQPSRYEYVRTGNSIKLVQLQIGKALSSIRRSLVYTHYESDFKEYLLFPLGIKVRCQWVYELTPIEVHTTFDQDIERLKSAALLAAQQSADFEITHTQYIINGDSVTAVCYGEVLLNATGETFDKNINQN